METSDEVYEWIREFLNTKNPLEIDLFNKPFDAKIDAAKYFKTKGNELYKNNKFNKAAIMYSKGLLQLDYTFPQTDNEIEIFDRLREDLNANSAMVALKMESYQSALHHCEQVLLDNPSNVKVLYRKGIALMKLGKIKEALELDPNNEEIIQLVNKLNTNSYH